jgi:hypothetical protein
MEIAVRGIHARRPRPRPDACRPHPPIAARRDPPSPAGSRRSLALISLGASGSQGPSSDARTDSVQAQARAQSEERSSRVRARVLLAAARTQESPPLDTDFRPAYWTRTVRSTSRHICTPHSATAAAAEVQSTGLNPLAATLKRDVQLSGTKPLKMRPSDVY